MFSTSSIIDNLNQEEGLEYKKLCRLLKISKKSDKDKLDIALNALEKLEIINKNDDNEYYKAKQNNHLVAKIRCSSKGYCFAVRDNSSEDIYIKENLLNYAWNGDKVLVRIIKEGYKRRSPEGIVDCILQRSNQILLAKVEVINNQTYGIPIDDRILSKIKLPKSDEKYKYDLEKKNIVKVEIDTFPIGQLEGKGHVIKELKLSNNEKLDTDFVLSKSNLNKINTNNNIKLKEVKEQKRIDLSDKNSFMLKSWNADNSPILPLIQIEAKKDKTKNLWIHTNAIAEKIDLSSKKSLELFYEKFESFPLLDKWQNYLSEPVLNNSNFNIGEKKEAISLCINLNDHNEIINWSFHLTFVKCAFIVDDTHTEALLTRKSKTRITSRLLKPIKEYIEELDKIFEISRDFRKNQLMKGKIEISRPANNIESLQELFIHNPVNYSRDYLEPLNNNNCQTFLSPILYEADSLWFNHSREYKLNTASYIPQNLDSINVGEIVKYSELIDRDINLNDDGNLTFKQIVDLCEDDKRKIILHKLLINLLKENEVVLVNKDSEISQLSNLSLSPWTLPSYDFINLMNQHNIYNMIINGKRANKNNDSMVNIMEMNSWKEVNWKIYNATISKNMDLLFNTNIIEKVNDYKNKAKQYIANMISIKQVRKAEQLVGNIYSGFITTVQSYGFFVVIDDLNLEGLVHVSTLNNDWYEYRSRQNLLIGRKSKKSYKIGDKIEIKIIKVDILKYQIDLELT